jgi:hypothetical protein
VATRLGRGCLDGTHFSQFDTAIHLPHARELRSDSAPHKATKMRAEIGNENIIAKSDRPRERERERESKICHDGGMTRHFRVIAQEAIVFFSCMYLLHAYIVRCLLQSTVVNKANYSTRQASLSFILKHTQLSSKAYITCLQV